jgi:diguanylate cyclase (GGDEF)-like protein
MLFSAVIFWPTFAFAWLEPASSLSLDYNVESNISPKKSLVNNALGQELLTLKELSYTQPQEVLIQLDSFTLLKSKKMLLIEKVSMLSSYINAYLQLENLELAEQSIRSLETLSQAHNKKWLDALLNHSKARLLLKNNEPDAALLATNSAIKTAKSIHYNDLVARAKGVRGEIFARMGNSAQALHDHLSALEYFEKEAEAQYSFTSNQPNNVVNRIVESLKQSNERKTIATLSALVRLSIYRKEWLSGLSFSKNVLLLLEQQTDPNIRLLAGNYINNSVIHDYLNHPQKALSSLLKAKKYALQLGEQRITLAIYANLADNQIRQENYQQAKEYADYCISKLTQNSDEYMRAICSINQSHAMIWLGQEEKGVKQLHDVHQRMIDNKLNIFLVDVYKTLYQAYQKIGNFKAALYWFDQYHTFEMEKNTKEKREDILALEQQFKSQSKEQEINSLTTENELQQELISKKNISLLYAAIATILGAVITIYLILRVTRLRRSNSYLNTSNQKLYDKSYHDHLTNLYNRRYLEEQRIEEASKVGKCSLVIIDIDYFKKVNDSYGHDVGDEVLVEIAKRLRQSIREQDIVARWGGEEFLALISHETQMQLQHAIQRLMENIRSQVFVTNAGSLSITVSMGICHIIDRQLLVSKWDNCVKSADGALYYTKEHGRNGAYLYNSKEMKKLV